MTKIKLCGLTRVCDIEAANELQPEYIGFVFAKNSRRYVTPEMAASLRQRLKRSIRAVGVFVDEAPETVAGLLNDGTIDIAQLHGNEDEGYIQRLRKLTIKPIIKAFRIKKGMGISEIEHSLADGVLLDSGGGTGEAFDWKLIRSIRRPFFLAGGLGLSNIIEAIQTVKPYAVDVSSGIETDGKKDREKMAAFVAAVRKEDVK